MTWRWIASSVVYAVHERQIAEHGGLHGVRDTGAVESALARPRNLASYEAPDAAELAAAYAFAIARNHPFFDGNKRTAWIVSRVFLADNGFELVCEAVDAIAAMQSLAAGTLGEEELAAWFRERSSKP